MDINKISDQVASIITTYSNQVFIEPIENVINKASQVGISINTVDDILGLPISERDIIAHEISRSYEKWAAAAALPTILGGPMAIPGFIGEVAALSVVSLRAVSANAISYGFNPKHNMEDLIIGFMGAAVAEELGIIGSNLARETIIRIITKEIIKSILKGSPRKILTLTRFTKIIPLVGAGISATTNVLTIKAINYTSRNNFRRKAELLENRMY